MFCISWASHTLHHKSGHILTLRSKAINTFQKLPTVIAILITWWAHTICVGSQHDISGWGNAIIFGTNQSHQIAIWSNTDRRLELPILYKCGKQTTLSYSSYKYVLFDWFMRYDLWVKSYDWLMRITNTFQTSSNHVNPAFRVARPRAKRAFLFARRRATPNAEFIWFDSVSVAVWAVWSDFLY